MAGTTSHSYILYRALRAIETNLPHPVFQSIVDSHKKAVVHARKNDPESLGKDDAAVLSGCAYIGSCGPDLFYLEYDEEAAFIADLLHYNRSGPFAIWWLRNLRNYIEDMMDGSAPKRVRQLAYCLGHISHIAADITIHPYVNSIVGAYAENPVAFKNARGWVPKTSWKFHHILEHYQDAYVLHRRFIGEEKFGCNPACVNLALPAASQLYQDGAQQLGFVDASREFYRYGSKLGHIEKYKYAFFANMNTVVNIKGYYSDVIPDEEMMGKIPMLVQGGTFNSEGKLANKGVFDLYIDQAVDRTVAMWNEVANFLGQENIKPAYKDHRLSYDELKVFPTLSKHWNLDCGMAPDVGAGSGSRGVQDTPDTELHMGVQLSFNSTHESKMDDFKSLNNK